MPTIFSHVIQTQFSRQNENVATEGLAFILKSSEAARSGMQKLLSGLVPELPPLWFRTQRSEDNKRPDMWGFDEKATPKVFIENKFWAGLTNNQPVDYLRTLAKYPTPTVLLVVAPETRIETLWRELQQRLVNAGLTAADRDASGGVAYSVTTSVGPVFAVTSWGRLLNCLEAETLGDRAVRNDLEQLRALCEAADSEAFVPMSPEQIGDQRIPAFVLQLTTIWHAAVDVAARQEVLDLHGTSPQASSERIGRYAYLGKEHYAGVWLGIHFGLWKAHGGSPLWVVFSGSDWGRSRQVRALLEPWAAQQRLSTGGSGEEFAVSLDLLVGADKDEVVKRIVKRLEEIKAVLSVLESKAAGTTKNEGGDVVAS